MAEVPRGSFHLNESLLFTGGAEGYILNLASVMRQRGIPVELGMGRDENVDIHNCYFLPKIHKRTSEQELDQNLESIEKLMSDNDLDIVHLHNIDHPALYRELHNRYSVVRTIHDYRSVCPAEFRINNKDEICRIPVGEACLSCVGPALTEDQLNQKHQSISAMNSLDLLITPSRYVKDQLELSGVTPEKIEVVPLFIPEDLPLVEEQEDSYSSDILFVGRLAKQKGLREALYSFSRLKGNFRFTVCGTGPDLELCRQMTKDLGIDNRVSFVGWVKPHERAKYYSNTKVVVVPSMWGEPFGLIGLEAMNYRKPVVGFNSGGIGEWLHNNENGYLLEPGDVNGLSHQLNTLLHYPNLAIEMGINGRNILEKEFSVEAHIRALMSIYNKI